MEGRLRSPFEKGRNRHNCRQIAFFKERFFLSGRLIEDRLLTVLSRVLSRLIKVFDDLFFELPQLVGVGHLRSFKPLTD